jgi:uncharacterized protein DUF3306
MATPPPDPPRFSLRRWSQRKLDATRKSHSGQAHEATPAKAPPATTDSPKRADAARADADSGAAATTMPTAVASSATPQAGEGAQPLPSIESLSIESDFTPFMQPGVDADVKRLALRKLFRDPRFNVMDGLDVYIDDYSKPDPIDPAVVRTLMQARYIFDPPKTRVNAEGHVEDVPAETAPADAAGEGAEAAAEQAPALASAASADAALVPPSVASENDRDGDPAPLPDSKAP